MYIVVLQSLSLARRIGKMKFGFPLPTFNPLGTAMKTWINVLGKFVIMNMHLVLREESLHSRAHLSEEYDFIVGKETAAKLVEHGTAPAPAPKFLGLVFWPWSRLQLRGF
jgi:hypothetical protein